jgi:hypothetical protein
MILHKFYFLHYDVLSFFVSSEPAFVVLCEAFVFVFWIITLKCFVLLYFWTMQKYVYFQPHFRLTYAHFCANRSDLSGGITSRTHRVLSLLWTAMIVIVLLKPEMSSTGCSMR